MRWSKLDDINLFDLFQSGKVDATALSSFNIEQVRAEFFPDREYKNFAPLYRKKARKWNTEQAVVGGRRGN